MLLHLPVGLSSRQTAHRRLSGAHNDRSQSHRQWLAVTAPAGRAYAVERVRPTCRAAPRCCQTKQVPKKGVEGRRREARRRPKKLRFISRGQKALAHPSLLPLTRGRARAPRGARGAKAEAPLYCVRDRALKFIHDDNTRLGTGENHPLPTDPDKSDAGHRPPKSTCQAAGLDARSADRAQKWRPFRDFGQAPERHPAPKPQGPSSRAELEAGGRGSGAVVAV